MCRIGFRGPRHPPWVKSATIYQINTRQFTPQGSFRAAEEHLPRLRDLGSQYAVRDYYGVNPEFGSLEDLRHFVAAAHEYGLHVLLDWVANHTAWDNVLVAEHPEWYARDWKGDFRPTPWFDWDDTIDLDYRQSGLRRYMLDAMVYWLREVDIDGYRCDAAGLVPVDFWEEARAKLDQLKPVFMIAEWEARDLHARAFDMTYAWTWNETMHRIAKGETNVDALRVYYAWNEGSYPPDAIRMTFVSNHDHNAWEGTEYEKFGDALEPAVVLSMVGHGMPLVYNGQEAGSDKRLPFFEKASIEWRDHPMGELYSRLIQLKKANSALWNSPWGATMMNVPNNAPDRVLSFVRSNDQDRVFVALNLSPSQQSVTLGETLFHGHWRDFFAHDDVELDPSSRLDLEPWDFLVLIGPHGPRSLATTS